MTSFIGVDWGTTNLRAWRMDANGQVEDSVEAPLGVKSITPHDFPHVFATEVRAPLGEDLPALLCGMVGSRLGWLEAAYVACPTSLRELASHTVEVNAAPVVRIVPGLSCQGVARTSDVMRGEETQILGYLAADPARQFGRRIVCLPGTHSKWVLVRDGVVERFVTAMTGEMFALLTNHSILRSESADFDRGAFVAGLGAAEQCEALSLTLFSARGRIVADGADPASTASYVSGLLIGAEVLAAERVLEPSQADEIAVIAAPELSQRYRDVLNRRAAHSVELEGGQAARLGLSALVREGALR